MRKENVKLFKNAELQIHIDIPRMNPLVAIFQQKLVQEVSTLLSLYPACSSYLVLDIVDGNSYSTLSSLWLLHLSKYYWPPNKENPIPSTLLGTRFGIVQKGNILIKFKKCSTAKELDFKHFSWDLIKRIAIVLRWLLKDCFVVSGICWMLLSAIIGYVKPVEEWLPKIPFHGHWVPVKWQLCTSLPLSGLAV